MSHVDDGILHAYLDGALDALADAGELPDGATAADVLAHLRACADCRSRLEAERAVREAAGVVLGDASLSHIDVPPFAAIESRPRPRRWVPLSWAASILLAMGAGWWGSEMWRAQPGSFATGQFESLALPSPDRLESTGAPVIVPESQAMGGDVGVDAGELRGADTRGGAMRADRTVIDARRDGQVMAPASQAAAVTSAAPPEVTPASQAAVTSAGDAPPPVAMTAGAPIGVPLSFASGAIAPGVLSTSDSQAAAAARQRVLDADGGNASFDVVIEREQAGRVPFTTPDSAGLRAHIDQIFVISDAPDGRIEVAREIGQTTVRVRQTLTTGVDVELLSWKLVAVELSALVVTGQRAARTFTQARPEENNRVSETQSKGEERSVSAWIVSGPVRTLADGRREVVLHAAPSLWLAIRADVSERELQVLASRLTRADMTQR
ncbi:MAG: zf-HC2 domain-containing protein [Gemmatimonadetes bacterium]|nr:zf-HC2 domain-containing protein [Gemmatimonadota bacterium]